MGNDVFALFLITTLFLLLLRESIQYYKGSPDGFDRNTNMGCVMLLFWIYRLARQNHTTNTTKSS